MLHVARTFGHTCVYYVSMWQHTHLFYRFRCPNKKMSRNFEPINLSCFVVDLRETRTWSFEHPILMAAHESTSAKLSPVTYGVHCPHQGSGYPFYLRPSQIHVPWPPTKCHSQCCPFKTVRSHPFLWDRNMEIQILPDLWFVWGWW